MDEDIHLLYVDKSKTAQRLLEKAVSQVAYVTSVATMAEALAEAMEGNYNFILSDYELPDGNGLVLAERLRQVGKHAKTPMLLYTAGMNNELAYQAMQAGFHDSLQKPMDMMSLTERIVELIELPEVKRFERRLLQIACTGWGVDGRYYEYSPDLNVVMHGRSEEHVREQMQQRLSEMMEQSREIVEGGLDPVDAQPVRHVIHLDV